MPEISKFKWYQVAVCQSLEHENKKIRDTKNVLSCIRDKHEYRIYLRISNKYLHACSQAACYSCVYHQ